MSRSEHWRDKTISIKPITNKPFVAFSGDIITDYNDLHCVFTCCIVPRKHKTMSAFVIGEMTNNKPTLHQRFSIPVLAPPPQLCIFCMSLFVNAPNSDNQLVRSELRAWTVFPLTWSLHSSLLPILPEQGKSVEVTSLQHIHSQICAAQRLHMDKCDII